MGSTRDYWEQLAAPSLRENFPELFHRLAAGLVGNGSECFGYDDEQSRDHDWGIDFFIWLQEEDRAAISDLTRWKKGLFARQPPAHARNVTDLGGKIGVMTVGDFYHSLIGSPSVPQTVSEWRRAPEENYALAVNGEVFWDGGGTFSTVRQGLLSYYPEDLRRKKIAARCMAIGQTGQYNFQRMARRGDWVTVNIVLSQFVQETMGLVYHLNRVYRPYYKWAWRGMERLTVLGKEIGTLLAELVRAGDLTETVGRQKIIDRICWLLAAELRRQKLSDVEYPFLAEHGVAVQRTIWDIRLRRIPPQYE